MRPIETTFLVACLLALLLPLFRGRTPHLLAHGCRWVMGVALIAALLVEGARWQLGPGLLAALIVWALPSAYFPSHTVGRITTPAGPARVLTVGSLVFVALALTLLSGALLYAMPVFSFPALSGPYAVGTRVYHWRDASREELCTAEAGDRRELMVQVWYPAEISPGDVAAPNFTDGATVPRAMVTALGRGLPSFLLDHLALVRSRAVLGAKPVAAGPFPVVLFCHGYGGSRAQNTAQVQELVSHGYVVIAPDFAYAAAASVFSNGRVAPFGNSLGFDFYKTPFPSPAMTADELLDVWVADVGFLLDQLDDVEGCAMDRDIRSILDLGRIGIMGHSFGGSTLTRVLAADERVKAGLNMDGFLSGARAYATFDKPYMLLAADYLIQSDEEFARGGLDDPLSKLLHDRRQGTLDYFGGLGPASYLAVLAGARHETFSNLPLFSPYGQLFGFGSRIDGARAIRILGDTAHAFFDASLKGDSATLQELMDGRYGELAFYGPEDVKETL